MFLLEEETYRYWAVFILMIQAVTACIFVFYITLPFGLVNIVSVSTETENKKTHFEGDFLLTSIFQNALSR